LESNEIYGTLNKTFREIFRDSSLNVNPETTARDVRGWDSLRNIRLMLAVEKAFRVKFSAAEIGKLQKVDDLAQLVRSKL
jgi:acyl carrier protein